VDSKQKLISLKDIEGKISPHQEQVNRALKIRSEALCFISDADALARFLGGEAEQLGLREDWALYKEIYPEVRIHIIFSRADSEFPSSLRVLFSGENLKLMSGEDLAGFAINCVSHMLRYVRDTNKDKKLPDVCYRV
jgi:hypothetical protein